MVYGKLFSQHVGNCVRPEMAVIINLKSWTIANWLTRESLDNSKHKTNKQKKNNIYYTHPAPAKSLSPPALTLIFLRGFIHHQYVTTCRVHPQLFHTAEFQIQSHECQWRNKCQRHVSGFTICSCNQYHFYFKCTNKPLLLQTARLQLLYLW